MNEQKKLAKMMNKLRELKGSNFMQISPNQPNKQELTGAIIAKERKIVYKKNEFHGNTYFRLKILEPSKEKPSILFVYSNVVSKQIFNDIENSNYIYKQYLFCCERIKRGWILNGWEELTANLALSSNQTKQLASHDQEK